MNPLIPIAVTLFIFSDEDTDGLLPGDNSPTPTGRLTPTDFIKLYYSTAMIGQSSGVPAIFTLAQGILESNSGNSELAKNANNFFGIKADSSWQGPTYKGYRKYDSPAASFADHTAFLNNDSRYATAFLQGNATDFAKQVAAAGYATDPDYANKIIKAMTAVNSIVNS